MRFIVEVPLGIGAAVRAAERSLRDSSNAQRRMTRADNRADAAGAARLQLRFAASTSDVEAERVLWRTPAARRPAVARRLIAKETGETVMGWVRQCVHPLIKECLRNALRERGDVPAPAPPERLGDAGADALAPWRRGGR